MSLRGAASIIGIGELKPERRKPGRTGPGLAQEVAKLCIEDSGLLKEDVDGLITEIPFANTCEFAEILGIQPTWSHGVNMMGSSGPTSVALAAREQVGCVMPLLAAVGAPDGAVRTLHRPFTCAPCEHR